MTSDTEKKSIGRSAAGRLRAQLVLYAGASRQAGTSRRAIRASVGRRCMRSPVDMYVSMYLGYSRPGLGIVCGRFAPEGNRHMSTSLSISISSPLHPPLLKTVGPYPGASSPQQGRRKPFGIRTTGYGLKFQWRIPYHCLPHAGLTPVRYRRTRSALIHATGRRPVLPGTKLAYITIDGRRPFQRDAKPLYTCPWP